LALGQLASDMTHHRLHGLSVHVERLLAYLHGTLPQVIQGAFRGQLAQAAEAVLLYPLGS
jgi:hypothetical protein